MGRRPVAHDPNPARIHRLTLSRTGVCERLGVKEAEFLQHFPKTKHGHYVAAFVDIVLRVRLETGLRLLPAVKVAKAIHEGRLP